MKEILYKYNSRGVYQTEDSTLFAGSSHMKILVESHEFSIAVGSQVLRSSSCKGCTAIVSCRGEVVFYDPDNAVIAKAEKGDRSYKQVALEWKQDLISILFGHWTTIDLYPNCDGESDRYEDRWITERRVSLNEKDHSLEIK